MCVRVCVSVSVKHVCVCVHARASSLCQQAWQTFYSEGVVLLSVCGFVTCLGKETTENKQTSKSVRLRINCPACGVTHMLMHTQTQTHMTYTVPNAMHFTSSEGHHHLFNTIKNLVLLLWKLLEIQFHWVCVIAVQVHAGKWSGGCRIIEGDASVCTLWLFNFIV